MPSPLTALRDQLLQLVERVGSVPTPSRRQQRALEQLLATRVEGRSADPYDLAARVAEVLAFVEDGVDSGSYPLGALAWVARRAAERLNEPPAPDHAVVAPQPAAPALPCLAPLRADPLVLLTQGLLGASAFRSPAERIAALSSGFQAGAGADA